MLSSAPSSADVIPLHPVKTETAAAVPEPAKDRRSERKWGKAVMDVGYAIIPSILLRAPRRLGLSPTQLAIVLVMAEFWWDPEKNPWPSKAELSNRLGLKERQLLRHVAELESIRIPGVPPDRRVGRCGNLTWMKRRVRRTSQGS